MLIKTQQGAFGDVKWVIPISEKGKKPKVVDEEGNRLAVYSSNAHVKVVVDDFGRWVSCNGKSHYGGRNRVFIFPSDKEV